MIPVEEFKQRVATFSDRIVKRYTELVTEHHELVQKECTCKPGDRCERCKKLFAGYEMMKLMEERVI